MGRPSRRPAPAAPLRGRRGHDGGIQSPGAGWECQPASSRMWPRRPGRSLRASTSRTFPSTFPNRTSDAFKLTLLPYQHEPVSSLLAAIRRVRHRGGATPTYLLRNALLLGQRIYCGLYQGDLYSTLGSAQVVASQHGGDGRRRDGEHLFRRRLVRPSALRRAAATGTRLEPGELDRPRASRLSPRAGLAHRAGSAGSSRLRGRASAD